MAVVDAKPAQHVILLNLMLRMQSPWKLLPEVLTSPKIAHSEMHTWIWLSGNFQFHSTLADGWYPQVFLFLIISAFQYCSFDFFLHTKWLISLQAFAHDMTLEPGVQIPLLINQCVPVINDQTNCHVDQKSQDRRMKIALNFKTGDTLSLPE